MSTIGAKIDALHQLREDKRALEEQVKLKVQEMDVLEAELLEEMHAQGVTKSTGKLATVSVSKKTRYTVEDWDAFYAMIHRTKGYHLLERRPAQAACDELMGHKGKIPGVVPFTQEKLNVRTV
jgi:hypothetical protein